MLYPSMNLRVGSATTLVLLGLSIGLLRAQSPAAVPTVDSCIGKKVITKLGVSIRVGDNEVDQRRINHTFVVRRGRR